MTSRVIMIPNASHESAKRLKRIITISTVACTQE